MSDIESETSVNETINETIEINDGEATKNIQKPKKPRTEKQIEALKKAQLKRAENIEKRKIEKENNKKLTKKEKLKKELEELEKQEKEINPSNNGMNEDYEVIQEDNLECNKVGKERKPNPLIEENKEQLRKLALAKPKKKKPVKQTIVYQDESSSSEEEEIIIKKKKKSKPKKKPKKKIVYESSSESESSSEEEEQQIPNNFDPVPARKLRYGDVFRFS
jgi:colicin import membrane protein